MGRILLPAAPRPRGVRGAALTLAALALSPILTLAGCGPGPAQGDGSTDSAVALPGDDSGFKLPPDFKTVDLPLERRKDVFREAHEVRALAVQEANLELPMDEAHLPHLDTKAFDKRVADHRAIIDRVLGRNLAALAGRYKIGVADVEKIEDEANRLRWTPPADPVFRPAKPDAGPRPRAEGKDGAGPGSPKSP